LLRNRSVQSDTTSLHLLLQSRMDRKRSSSLGSIDDLTRTWKMSKDGELEEVNNCLSYSQKRKYNRRHSTSSGGPYKKRKGEDSQPISHTSQRQCSSTDKVFPMPIPASSVNWLIERLKEQQHMHDLKSTTASNNDNSNTPSSEEGNSPLAFGRQKPLPFRAVAAIASLSAAATNQPQHKTQQFDHHCDPFNQPLTFDCNICSYKPPHSHRANSCTTRSHETLIDEAQFKAVLYPHVGRHWNDQGKHAENLVQQYQHAWFNQMTQQQYPFPQNGFHPQQFHSQLLQL